MSKNKKKEFKELAVGGEAPEETEYKRPRWKHFLRWVMFSFVATLYIMLMLQSYNSHVLHHHGFILKELIVYILCSVMMIPIVPSVVLEVDYVKITRDEVVFRNLLMSRTESWANVEKLFDPMFLKFAILKTKGFVYLLNRRDLPNFGQLVETIRAKAVNLKN